MIVMVISVIECGMPPLLVLVWKKLLLTCAFRLADLHVHQLTTSRPHGYLHSAEDAFTTLVN